MFKIYWLKSVNGFDQITMVDKYFFVFNHLFAFFVLASYFQLFTNFGIFELIDNFIVLIDILEMSNEIRVLYSMVTTFKWTRSIEIEERQTVIQLNYTVIMV